MTGTGPAHTVEVIVCWHDQGDDMPKSEPFERRTERYDDWFDRHEPAYRSEVRALQTLIGDPGDGLEIGVGTGRFAEPLGFEFGVDPAREMLIRARDRGVAVVDGVAEALPFRSGSFDTALMVTTICFVDDIPTAIAEAKRVVRPGGSFVLGYIDKESPVGRIYQEKKADNPFYEEAVFVSTDDLVDALEAAGFDDFEFVQTIFEWPGDLTEPEPVETGYGEGSFVGIEATL